MLCQNFAALDVKINHHIPRHSRLQRSTIADKYEKDTGYLKENTAPSNVSTTAAFTVAGELRKKSRRRLWEQTGGCTY